MQGNRNSATVRIGTWNTANARPWGPKGKLVKAALAAPGCDVLCVTEGFPAIFADQGHVITALQDWGSQVVDDRRKVQLWKKRPWTHIDRVGSEGLPGGRFLSGVTRTTAGWPLTIVGGLHPLVHGTLWLRPERPQAVGGPHDLACRIPEAAIKAARFEDHSSRRLQPQDSSTNGTEGRLPGAQASIRWL